MATNPKQKIIDGVTPIGNAILQPIMGGDATAAPTDPNFAGHFHDLAPGVMGSSWGHVSQIDLTNHTTNRLVLQDQYAVLKSVSLPSSAAAVLSSGIVWYFTLPTDLDVSKPAYFSFAWMGDSTDGSSNILNTTAQSSVFEITWQWYIPGYAIYTPSVIYDGQSPANQVGSNINANSLTRGRIPNLTINTQPFQLLINDSASGSPNYAQLTGLDQAQTSVMVGVQVEIVSTGFPNGVIFFNGTLTYLSKTLGAANLNIGTL